MDGQNIVTKPDQARLVTAFETLLEFDDNYQLQTDGLAESVEADNPTQYTIKLRKGSSSRTARPSPPTTSSTRCSASVPRRTA